MPDIIICKPIVYSQVDVDDTHVIFFAKEHKGHKGVEGTPVETSFLSAGV